MSLVSVITINYQFYWYRGKAIITVCICFNLLVMWTFHISETQPIPKFHPVTGL